MKLKPRADRVVVKRDDADSISKGGIVIPEKAKEEQSEGVVVAAGPDTLELEEGDKVIFGKFAGTVIEDEGSELVIMKEEEVFGVIV